MSSMATVGDIVPSSRGLTFASKPVPPVPNVVDDPAWLIATSGFCSNLNVIMKDRDVEASATEGDTAAHFIADISFNYYPQTAVKFTDFPHHLAKTIEGDAAEADALISSSWDHKNIALLEPTSSCGTNKETNQAWGISVFKVEEHRKCTDGETAWDGHPCVHYTGYVSAETSNFVNVNEERFVCQLFVDSTVCTILYSASCGEAIVLVAAAVHAMCNDYRCKSECRKPCRGPHVQIMRKFNSQKHLHSSNHVHATTRKGHGALHACNPLCSAAVCVLACIGTLVAAVHAMRNNHGRRR